MSIWSLRRMRRVNGPFESRRNGFGQNLAANKLRKSLLLLLLLIFKMKQSPNNADLRNIAKAMLCRHMLLRYEFDDDVDNYTTIESYGESIKRDLRFEADHIRLLLKELKFPDDVVLSFRIRMSGEEIFLRGLYELATGNYSHVISNHFGRGFYAQSRAFNYFIDHIYDNFHHLVHNNLDWWFRNGFWEKSAAAIEKKINQNYPLNTVNAVSHFVNCSCSESTLPGGGLAESGANAARWNVEIQRYFYDQWKSIDGMEHQTVDNAYGMTEDICGPTSLRRSNLAVLRKSKINDRFAAIQEGCDIQYIIFGDSAYRRQSHITSYFKYLNMDPISAQWNKSMKRVCVGIEWNYGVAGSLFRYLRYKDKFAILESSRVSKIYTVATLLRNFHIALYGGQSMDYFALKLPEDMLIHYIRNEDFI